jgi:hypothetical protein
MTDEPDEFIIQTKRRHMGKTIQNEIITRGKKAYISLSNKNGETIAQAIIDIDDLDKVKKFVWCGIRSVEGKLYVISKVGKLHRFILGLGKGNKHTNQKEIDHINQNALDNRKSNLRYVEHTINMRNRKISKRNKTGINGVQFDKEYGVYFVQLNHKGKNHKKWGFKTIEEAELARKKLEKKFGWGV